MRFDPFRFHRKSIRYASWDYRTPGYYFVTLCTFKRQPLFVPVKHKDIICFAWARIAEIPHVSIDESIVMSDHFHGIIRLDNFPSPQQTEPEPCDQFQNAPTGSIGAIVGGFKTITTKRINRLRDAQGNRVWQRGYWDRIIRNERELNAIREYIQSNPQREAEKRDNLELLLQTRMLHHP